MPTCVIKNSYSRPKYRKRQIAPIPPPPQKKQTAKTHSENVDEVVQKEQCLWNI